MEKIVFIKEVFDLAEAQSTRFPGSEPFYSRGLLLTTDHEEFYGELVGNNARFFTLEASPTIPRLVQGYWYTRQWEDQSGHPRFDNKFRITHVREGGVNL